MIQKQIPGLALHQCVAGDSVDCFGNISVILSMNAVFILYYQLFCNFRLTNFHAISAIGIITAQKMSII